MTDPEWIHQQITRARSHERLRYLQEGVQEAIKEQEGEWTRDKQTLDRLRKVWMDKSKELNSKGK